MGQIDELYSTIGGSDRLDAAIRAFYRRVLEDEDLRPFFRSTDMAQLRSGQSMFVAMLLGARVYTGRDIRVAHAEARGLGLTHAHMDAFLEHFRAALTEIDVDPDNVEKMMKLLEGQRAAVLNH